MSSITQSADYQQMITKLQDHISSSPQTLEMRKFTHYLLKSPNIGITGVFSTELKKMIQDAELQELIVKIDGIASKIFSSSNRSNAASDVKVMSRDLKETVEKVIGSGKSYQKSLKGLQTVIRQLENPYLKKDLIGKMSELKNIVTFAQTNGEGSEDIYASKALDLLKGIEFSSKVKAALQSLISEIVDYIRLQDEPKEIAEKITKEILSLSHMRAKDPLESAAFEVFCRLPQVLRFSNEDMREIKSLILKKDEDDLQAGVKHILKNMGIKSQELDREIEKRDEKIEDENLRYHNLENLLLEILEGDVQAKGGLTPYWDKDPEFFEGRTLDIHDPDTLQQVNGVIVSAHFADNEWTFKLDNLQEVVIDDQDYITVTRKKEQGLSQIIREGVEKTFHLKGDYANLFAGGNYRITQSEKLSSHLQISLETVNAPHHDYQIRLYPEKEDDTSIQIYEKREGNFKEVGGRLTCEELDFLYQAVTSHDTPFLGIDQDNVDDHCKVSDEVDEEKVKLFTMNKNAERLKKLRASLSPQLKDELLGYWIKAHLKEFEESIIQAFLEKNGALKKELEDISSQYQEKLGLEYSPRVLLKQIVEEANYLSLTNQEGSLLDLKMMEKLHQLDHQNSLLKDKNIILFMGDRHSEKTSFIHYLLGKKEAEALNPEPSLDASDPQEGLSLLRHPIISPQVFYTQGYVKNGWDYVLTEGPDIKNIEGVENQFYANLSLNRVIQKARSLQAVVTALAVDDFREERESYLLDTIQTTQKLFKDSFNFLDISNRVNQENNRNFFLAVTQENANNKKLAASIKNGSVIDQFFAKADQQFKALSENTSSDAAQNTQEVDAAWKRRNLWAAMQKMQTNKQIHLLNPKHISAISRLLTQYTKDLKVIGKERYRLGLESNAMRIQLSWHLQQLTLTWMHTFLKPYHETIPQTLQELENKIKEGKKQAPQLKEQEAQQEKSFREKSHLQESLKTLITQLEEMKKDVSTKMHHLQGSKENLDRVDDHPLFSEYPQLKKRMIEEREKNKSTIISLHQRYKELDLEHGKNLAQGEEILRRRQRIQESRDKCISEIKKAHFSKEDFYQSYKDKLAILLPNADLGDILRELQKEPLERHTWAIISEAFRSKGVNSVPRDLERLTRDANHPSGSVKAESLNVEEYHRNIEAFDAVIKKMASEIPGKDKEIAELDKERSGYNKRMDNAAYTINGEVVPQISKEEIRLREQFLKQELQATETALVSLQAGKNETPQKIKETDKMLKQSQEQKEALEKQKRNLAIVIATQGKYAALLRDFADLAVNSDHMIYKKPPLVNSCQEFINYFDQNYGQIEASIKSELNLT